MTMQYKDEIEWKELLQKPAKLFGYSYVYALAVLVGIGLLYIHNLSTVGKNLIMPSVTSDSAAVVSDIPLQSPRVVPPANVMKVGVTSVELVNKGKDLYKTHCVSCHGESGTGNGPTGSMMTSKPKDFTQAAQWKNGVKVSQIYKTLEEGIPGTGMASFNYLLPEDRFALAHFVRTFSQTSTKDTQDELKQLDATYQLSSGLTITGQIPIRKASKLIIKETEPQTAAVKKIVQSLRSENSRSLSVFRAVVQDEERAVTMLLKSKKSVTNVDALVQSISINPLQAGFKPGVARLSAEEWNDLYGFVQTIQKYGVSQ